MSLVTAVGVKVYVVCLSTKIRLTLKSCEINQKMTQRALMW